MSNNEEPRMTYIGPGAHTGTIDISKQTKESEYSRQWLFATAQVLLRFLAFCLVLLEAVLIGPAAPAWFAAGALVVKGIYRFRFLLDTHEAPQLLLIPRKGVHRDPVFMVGVLLSVVFCAFYITGYWLPLSWRTSDGYLWWVMDDGATGRVLPGLGTLPVWVRYGLIFAMPWILYSPGALLHWVFRIESTFSNFRQTTFTQADPSSIPTPVGVLRTPSTPKPIPPPARPASSAPVSGQAGQPHVAIQAQGDGQDIVDL